VNMNTKNMRLSTYLFFIIFCITK